MEMLMAALRHEKQSSDEPNFNQTLIQNEVGLS
jgi:hypothetical protein